MTISPHSQVFIIVTMAMRSPDFLPSCRWKDHKMRKMLNDTQKASISVILTPWLEIVLIHIRTPKRKRNISFFSSLFLQLFLTQKLHFCGARKDLDFPFSAQSAQRPWMMRVSSVCIGSSMYRPHGLFPNTQTVQQSGGVNQSGGGSRHMKSVSSWR